MIKKLFIASFLGGTAFLLISQNDVWVKQRCLVHLQALFKDASGATFNATIDRIDFFTPTCECVNVVVKPIGNQSWTWHAKRLVFRFSWLDFLWTRSINLDLIFEGFQGLSIKKENDVPLFEHIKICMAPAQHAIPIYVKSMSLKPASLIVRDVRTAATWSLKWHSDSKICATGTKSHLYCLNGKISVDGVDYLNAISGSLSAESRDNGLFASYHGTVKGSCTAFFGPDKPESLFINGSWNGQSGVLDIKNEDASVQCTFSDMQLTADGGISAQVNGLMPVRDFAQSARIDLPLTGTINANGLVMVHGSGASAVRAEVVVQDAGIADFASPCAVKTTVNKDGTLWRGQATLMHAGESMVDASWQWDQGGVARGVATLVESCAVPPLGVWIVQAPHAHLTIEKDEHGVITGAYDAQLIEKNSHERAALTGSFKVGSSDIKTEGAVNDIHYKTSVSWSEAPYLTQFLVSDNAGKKVIDCSLSPASPDCLEGAITIEGMNMIAAHLVGSRLGVQAPGDLNDHVQGQGTAHFSLTVGDCLKANVRLADAVVRVPYLYNVINGFDATIEYDFAHKQGIVRNLHCSLDRGTIKCGRATCLLDNSYAIQHVFFPLLMHECLLSVNKDLFALVSARLLFLQKKEEVPQVIGSIILERAQLKENIFSQEFQEKIVQSAHGVIGGEKMDMACALSMETAGPIRVETAFLQANAHCALTLGNTVREPSLSGLVTIGSGALYFPYKSLFITKGRLHFTPDQRYDPVVELIAKSKIKKYNVTLNATGTLQNHQISLESTPPLTEEQIMALLLIGSHEESLNIVMPALIMSNLTSLLFGDVQSRDSLDVSFRRLFKPFDNVHLVPSFTDQTGRGGLRGAIEIDVTDRLHALIQKNFSLSEDTRVEIEYLLSDDVSVRAIRNERRDVGGEVEMRWKF